MRVSVVDRPPLGLMQAMVSCWALVTLLTAARFGGAGAWTSNLGKTLQGGREVYLMDLSSNSVHGREPSLVPVSLPCCGTLRKMSLTTV